MIATPPQPSGSGRGPARWLILLACLGMASCGSCHGSGHQGGTPSPGSASGSAGGGAAASRAPAPGKAGASFTAPVSAAEIAGYPVPQAVDRVERAKHPPHLDPGTALAGGQATPVANSSVRVELLGASRHHTLPGAVAPQGETFVVLDTRWTNVHPKARVSKASLAHHRDVTMGLGAFAQGATPDQKETVLVDVAYEVPHFIDHAYLLADGVAYPMARAGLNLVHGAPVARAFTLDRQGDRRELRFAYLVPDSAADLAFRFFDYANGAVAFPVAGDPAKAVGDGQPPAGAIAHATAKRLDLAVTSVNTVASWGGVVAPQGWHLVTVGLAGKSLSASGKLRDIVQVDPRQYLWVVTGQGTLRYGSGGTVNGQGVLRFTPEVYQRETAVFLIPDGETPRILGLRDGGEVTRLDLGKGGAQKLPAGAATARDGSTLEVRVVSLWRGEDEAVLDLVVQNLVADKGVALDPQQFPLSVDDGTVVPDTYATSGLAHRPPSPFVVPPGGSLRFSLAYETKAAPLELKMRGENGEVDLGLAKVAAPKTPPRRGARTHEGDDLVTAALDPGLAETSPDAVPAGQAVTGPGGGARAPADGSATGLEPDDDRDHAHVLAVGQTARGSLDPQEGPDQDVYRVDVGAPGIYQVDAAGDHVEQVILQRADEDSVTRDANHGHAVIRDLFLTPGPHYFTVVGTDGGSGPYTVKVSARGPTGRWGEHEPNDEASEAERLPLGQVRTGRIPDGPDRDLYRLSLQARTHVRIVLSFSAGPAGALLPRARRRLDHRRGPASRCGQRVGRVAVARRLPHQGVGRAPVARGLPPRGPGRRPVPGGR